MYVDDAAIFINLEREELQATKEILETFNNATGLQINFEKKLHPPDQV
jgi:hypothetical protein